MSEIFHACSSGNLEEVKRLIDNGADSNAKLEGNVTCLMLACTEGHLSIVKYLVEETGADIEEKTSYGHNCLMVACATNHLSIVKYLVEERQANVDAVDRDNKNCLLLACELDNHAIVQYLSEKRHEAWRQDRTELQHFLRDLRLQKEWERHRESTFIHGVPLYVTHAHELLENNPGPPADLKVRFCSPGECVEDDQRNSIVYAKKKQLIQSCSFMRNLLTGEMSDVQDDPEHEDMQMVELSEDLIQDCPAEWLKQLIAFLSWAREDDELHHTVRSTTEDAHISFDELQKALKYCRMCHTLGIDVDVSAWTDFIKGCLEKYNNQWIESELKTEELVTEKGNCIRNIHRFDQEMLELWTQVLGESDALYFFMLVNAAPATAESRSTIASQCREWLMSDESSKKYEESLKKRIFIAVLHLRINFNITTGEIVVPVSEGQEFVPRKKRRME